MMPINEWAKKQKPNYRVTSLKAHHGTTEWFFFTCNGAQAWLAGELEGQGNITRLSDDRPICPPLPGAHREI